MNKFVKLGLGTVLGIVLAIVAFAIVVVILVATFAKASGGVFFLQTVNVVSSRIPTTEEFVKGTVQTCMAGRSDDTKLAAFCDCVGNNLRTQLTNDDMIATKGNSLPPQVQKKIDSAESMCQSS